jgi:hypothetical protein
MMHYDLIGQLMQKMGVDDWVQCYETNLKR